MNNSERLEILKADFHTWGDSKPDKDLGLEMAPKLKAPMGGEKTQLPRDFENLPTTRDITQVLDQRKSTRKFSDASISLEQLSYCLYYTQGIRKITSSYTFRTVPSGGIRHPFETYLLINRVEGLKPGVYHYLPEDHSLELMFEDEARIDTMSQAARGQKYVATAAVTFIWACIPYRTVWRYQKSAYKTMLLDAGHICQNLYTAVSALGLGTVAIGNYDQEMLDSYLGIDGENELSVYLAPVGHPG